MDLQAVGKRIQQVRRERGLTQEQLAEAVGLSPTHLSVIERGAKPTKITNFVAIANVLEVSADELLLDVLDHTAKVESTELYHQIAELPVKSQDLILKVLRIMIEEMKTP
jgi:transcriptional regulator with XRE-family HTH domain